MPGVEASEDGLGVQAVAEFRCPGRCAERRRVTFETRRGGLLTDFPASRADPAVLS